MNLPESKMAEWAWIVLEWLSELAMDLTLMITVAIVAVAGMAAVALISLPVCIWVNGGVPW